MKTIRRFSTNQSYGVKSRFVKIAVLWGYPHLKCQDFIFVLGSAIMCYAYKDFCVLKMFFSRVQGLAHIKYHVWKLEYDHKFCSIIRFFIYSSQDLKFSSGQFLMCYAYTNLVSIWKMLGCVNTTQHMLYDVWKMENGSQRLKPHIGLRAYM